MRLYVEEPANEIIEEPAIETLEEPANKTPEEKANETPAEEPANAWPGDMCHSRARSPPRNCL